MDTTMVYSMVRTAVALLACIWILSAIHRCRVERHRQKLFEIRDALFDYAAAGNIAFTHPAYAMVRSTINGFIRHAHRISVVQMIAFLFLSRRDRLTILTDSFDKRWAVATRDLDAGVRNHLWDSVRQTNLAVATYFAGSLVPLLLCLLGSAYVASRCVRLVTAIESRVKQALDELDRTALACGR